MRPGKDGKLIDRTYRRASGADRGNNKKTESVATDCGEDVHRVESDEKKVRYNGRWHSFKAICCPAAPAAR